MTNTIKAWTLQSLYTGASYGPAYSRISQLVLRDDVLQVGKSLLRVTLPRYAWVTSPNGTIRGLGDTFLAYLFALPATAGNHFGLGLNAVVPTATKSQLGIDSWAIGPAAAQLHVNPAGSFASGFFFQSYFSVAGPANRRYQSVIFFQPLTVARLGSGWSVRSADALWTFDMHDGSTLVPLSLGIGKLMPAGRNSINLVLSDSVVLIHAHAPNSPKSTLKLIIRWMDAPARI